MHHFSSKVAVFVMAVLAAAISTQAEEDVLRAEVIDSNTERVPRVTVAPQYPGNARRDRVEGQVQVCFDVSRRGRPRRIAVRLSTHRAFERPSIKAVRASSFVPLERDEPLQSAKLCRTFIFTLVPVEK